MGENSFTSILILLVLFIVIPSVLKFLGQYTMSSKTGRKPMQEHELPPEEGMHESLDAPSRPRNYETLHEDAFSNKPIKPKWF
jgi:hypothetical protein